MAKTRQEQYGNSSISMLKGEERVRKRPAVIFGSDDLEGCKHAVFEILSNAIDEAREGHGDTVIVTRYEDYSVEVEDFGRGCPVDYNEKEKRYNWELVFCEMYAGGKYGENGENYEYSLGLNGLGSSSTRKRPVLCSIGSRIPRYLPTSISLWNTTGMCCAARQW